MKDLVDELKKLGLGITPCFTGEFIRNDSEWFIGHEYTINGKKIYTASFGDWRLDLDRKWQSTDANANDLTEEELAEFRHQYEEKAKLQKEKKAALWEETSIAATKLFKNSIRFGETPYTVKKKLTGHYWPRIHPDQTECLLVPAYDETGKLWGLQKIYPDGLKQFMPGMRVTGCYSWIDPSGAPNDNYEGEFYVAEGFATAASIYDAIKKPTVCAFNAGNLKAAALNLQKRFPNAKFILCADDDRFTTRPDGTPYNPGLTNAVEAALAVNGLVCVPVFESYDGKPTDFNDLAYCQGLEAVRAQIEKPTSPEKLEAVINTPETESPAEEIPLQASLDVMPPKVKLERRKDAKGELKVTVPSQQKLANELLKFYDGKIIKQDRDLFYYTGTHWRLLTLSDHDRLKQQIQSLAGQGATNSQVNSVFNLFVVHLPTPPPEINMFTPRPLTTNFLNGTLFVRRRKRGDYEFIFREHNPSDFIINVLPYEYREHCTEVNQEFEDMLRRVTEGDSDQEEKIRAIAQKYGACLMTTHPHIWMLYGPPGTGKSTIMKIAARFVHPDNLCSVEPKDFDGFNMETMAGKLVNIDTDIDLSQPIGDSIVKKIEDRMPMRIRRKGLRDIYAPLPAVHIFGGNELPKTLEGISRAHDRRWTFLEFRRSVIANGDYDKGYAEWCFEQNPQGVLNFAIKGLKDLLANDGHFINPASGKAKMEEWQLRSDIVGQFLKAIDEGEVLDKNNTVIRDENAEIERGSLWECFKAWYEGNYNSASRLGKTTFFDRLRSKGIKEKKTEKNRYFVGVGLRVADNARQ